jgi:V-type H+-transporting ATPase subunit d
LKATLNNPNINVNALTEQLHPLGKFKEGIIRSICSFENSPRGYAELYHTVLVGIPVGKYMRIFITEEGERGMHATGQVRSLLEEMPTTKLENSLRKYYLEDAYAINITLNSFNTPLNELNMRIDRQHLFPSIGHLYPDGFSRIAAVSNDDELGQALQYWKQYNAIFESYRSEEKTIDDLFYEKEVMECELAFEGQFSYACFYSFMRLKEAEIRNITWVSECIIQRAKTRIMQHYVPIFTRTANWRHA